ncbi:hypothetical protein [Parapedobacter tibetensis]|uniref:hypothetical protein n=1 Tax=Parapedobacter tibetensis TaxID=2972951 RepID=UPI00214D72C9|nr:hypothetical protein [Parapedobacter tibetensis]
MRNRFGHSWLDTRFGWIPALYLTRTCSASSSVLLRCSSGKAPEKMRRTSDSNIPHVHNRHCPDNDSQRSTGESPPDTDA